jgi:hypothetical protein
MLSLFDVLIIMLGNIYLSSIIGPPNWDWDRDNGTSYQTNIENELHNYMKIIDKVLKYIKRPCR